MTAQPDQWNDGQATEYIRADLYGEALSAVNDHRTARLAALEAVQHAQAQLVERDQEIETLRAECRAARNAALEEAMAACQKQQEDFLSPEYATGQPISSVWERAACGACIQEIRALKEPTP